MGTDDEPQPEQRPAKTDQELFDAEMARDTTRALPILAGLGILAALVMSTIALINSGGGTTTTTTTVTVAGGSTAGKTPGGAAASSKSDALGRQLFVVGDPSGGAPACGTCHTMKAAGTVSTVGPNLDTVLTADPPSATRESIVDPNKEIVTGYAAHVMPKTYGTALDKRQLDALVNYVYHSTNTKAKHQRRGG